MVRSFESSANYFGSYGGVLNLDPMHYVSKGHFPLFGSGLTETAQSRKNLILFQFHLYFYFPLQSTN